MIGFFRKIRKQLADDNQFFKYTRYAIGEIMLVVIGILIALQLNSWNQKRLDSIGEQRVLTAINEEMELNSFLFNRGKAIQERNMAASKNLLHAMNSSKLNENTLEKELDGLLGRWLSGTPTTVYDALIGSGDLGLLSSEHLRGELAGFKTAQDFLALFEAIQTRFVDQQLSPFLNQYIDRISIRQVGDSSEVARNLPTSTITPNYDELLKSRLFSNLLVEYMEHSIRVVRNYDRLEVALHRIDSTVASEMQQKDTPKP